MADNETSYLPIGTCLEQIEKAVYGREVRQAIHDGIAQCYDDTTKGVNAAQQAASDTQEVIDNAVTATNRANTAASEASNVKVEQTVSGDAVTFTTTKRDGSTVSTSFQKPNVVVSKDEGSGEFSVTAKGWNGEEIIAKIPDPSEEVKSRATIASVSKVKTALGNPLTITDGMDAPAVKTVVTLEPKQDLHGYDRPWVGGAGKNLIVDELFGGVSSITADGVTMTVKNGGFHLEGSSGRDSSTRRALKTKEFTLKAGTYTFSKSASDNIIAAIQPASAASSYITLAPADKRKTYTFSEDTAVVFGANILQNTTYNADIHVQLEAGDTATSYEPYSNICPIEGYDTVRVTATGKNLFPAQRTYTSGVRDDSGNLAANASSRYTMPIYGFLPKTTYAISGTRVVGGTGYRIYYLDKKGAWISRSGVLYSNNDTFTTPADCYAIQLQTHVNLDLSDIQIELGSAPTSYAPQSSLTSLSVAQAAGATVYGGTVTLNEDGSGTLVVDRVYAEFDGSNDEAWMLAENNDPQYTYFRIILGAINSVINHSEVSNAFMDVLITGANTNSGVQVLNSTAYGAALLYVRLHEMSEYTTVDSFRSYLASNPLQIVYKLSIPSNPIQLTASQLRTLTGENHVWTDGTKLELTYRADKYADVEKFLNAIPTGTKTGDPAVFADGADDLPFEKLTIAVEPHQEGSGDPSPDNIRPITGWDEVKVTRCGKNLLGGFADYTVYGITIKDTANGISIRGTFASGQTQFSYTLLNKVLPAGAYVVNGVAGAGGSSYQLVITGGGMSATKYGATNNTTFTSDGTTAVIVRLFVYSGGSPYNVVIPWQIEIGSTPTAYEPCIAHTTLPISLKYVTGSTVYGGTVTINRDGTGSVVVDRAMVDMGSLLWLTSSGTSYPYFRTSGLSATISKPSANGVAANIKCEEYKTTSANEPYTGTATDCICVATTGEVQVYDPDYTTVSAFTTAVTGTHLVYKLATPTTYTLTAPQLTSLLGNNTVWCDAGQVTVKYKRDIGKMISNLYALMVDTGVIVIENEEDVTVEGPHYNP